MACSAPTLLVNLFPASHLVPPSVHAAAIVTCSIAHRSAHLLHRWSSPHRDFKRLGGVVLLLTVLVPWTDCKTTTIAAGFLLRSCTSSAPICRLPVGNEKSDSCKPQV